MKRSSSFYHAFFFTCCLFVSAGLYAQTTETADKPIFPSSWVAGTVVDAAVVSGYGIDKCFVAETISDEVFARMWNKSYKKGCPVPREQLRYLKVLHRNAEGNIQLGEMVCNAIIADKLVRIFRSLYDAGYKIESMRLVDDFNADDDLSMKANNTSCFNYRPVPGTQHLSNHAKGLALDLNPLYNPFVRTRNGVTEVLPKTGRKYAFNRATRKEIPYKIDRNDLAYKKFIAEGFNWGGAWRTMKDYQHFEFKQ